MVVVTPPPLDPVVVKPLDPPPLDPPLDLRALDTDALRVVVARLSLWDARALQFACPSLTTTMAAEVEACIDRASRAPRPECVDEFAAARPSFQERCAGCFVLLRTPRDLRVQSVEEGVAVTATRRARGVRVEVRVVDPAVRPGFAALQSAVARVKWMSEVFDPCVTEFRTRATTHNPFTELLNVLVTRFVETRLGKPCL